MIMRNGLFVVVSMALLWSCNDAPKEIEDKEEEPTVALNSNWRTGHLIGMVQTLEETQYTADSLGVIDDMDSCCIEVKTYDEQGYVKLYVEKNREGDVVFESVRDHFPNGRWKSAVNKRNGRPAGGRTVTLDPDGKILHAIDTDSTGQVTYYFDNIKENEIGQPLEGTRYRADSTYTGTWTRQYTDGMTTGWGWRDSTDTMVYENVGELNDKGLMAKLTMTERSDNDSITTTVRIYTYDNFDEEGNWTQRTITEDGLVTKVQKRSYTYFKKE
jgi:hypothetical protein